MNFVLYNRPSASDFDDWASEYDNPGWSSKELVPLLQKVSKLSVEVRIYRPILYVLM